LLKSGVAARKPVRLQGVPSRTGKGIDHTEAVKGVEGFKEFKGFAPKQEQIL
jgi:hypothetical protein